MCKYTFASNWFGGVGESTNPGSRGQTHEVMFNSAFLHSWKWSERTSPARSSENVSFEIGAVFHFHDSCSEYRPVASIIEYPMIFLPSLLCHEVTLQVLGNVKSCLSIAVSVAIFRTGPAMDTGVARVARQHQFGRLGTPCGRREEGLPGQGVPTSSSTPE